MPLPLSSLFGSNSVRRWNMASPLPLRHRQVEARLLLLLLLLGAAVSYCHAGKRQLQQREINPGAASPPATTCRVLLRESCTTTATTPNGPNRTANAGNGRFFSLVDFSIRCSPPVNAAGSRNRRAYTLTGGTANNSSNSGSSRHGNTSVAASTSVKVRFGRSLLNHLLYGSNGKRNLRFVRNMVGVNADWSSGPRPGAQALPAAGNNMEDWGIDFLDVPHLKLVDTVVSEMPLSSAGPLLQCLNCSYLTTQNVTIRALQGGSSETESASTASFGAVRVTGLQGATLQGVHCSEVRSSLGWACILLQVSHNAMVRIEDSSFQNNTVGGGASSLVMSNSTELPSHLVRCTLNGIHEVPPGYGAVLVAYDRDDDLCMSGQAGGSDAVVLVEGTVISNNVGGCGAGLAVKGFPIDTTTPYEPTNCAFGEGRHVYLNVSNSNITGNNGIISGGGVYYDAGFGQILHVAFSNRSVLSQNSADGDGGGAALYSPIIDSITITGSELSDNIARSSGAVGDPARNGGGGIFAVAYSDNISAIAVHSSQLSRNRATASGGGIYVRMDWGTVKNISVDGGSVLQNNSADSRGGAVFVLCQYGMPDIVALEQQSVLYGNVAGEHGGGIAVEAESGGSDVDVNISGRIDSNEAKDGNGGAIYMLLSQFRNVSIRGTNLTRNTASCKPGNDNCIGSGGGIFISSTYNTDCAANGALNIDQSLLANNTASSEGGAIYLNCGLVGSNRTISIHGSTIIGNTAVRGNGGAVSFTQEEGNFASCTISGSSFVSNNASGKGGALYLMTYSDWENGGGLFRIEGGSVASSNAANLGGFLFLSSRGRGVVDLTINGSQVIDNKATQNGGAIYVIGDNDVAAEVLGGSTVARNSAGASGGAFFITTYWSFKLRIGGASRLIGNRAEWGDGGGICSLLDSRALRSLADDMGCADVLVEEASLVANNTAEAGNGGAIFMRTNWGRIDRVAVRDGSLVQGNTAGGNGGAIALIADRDSLRSMTWTGHSALSNNTALRGNGGGIYIRARANQVSVLGASRWIGNTAQQADGGALFIVSTIVPIDAATASTIITVGEGSLLSENHARRGGAIYALGSSLVNVSDDSTIDDLNTADYNGSGGGSSGVIIVNNQEVPAEPAIPTFDNDSLPAPPDWPY